MSISVTFSVVCEEIKVKTIKVVMIETIPMSSVTEKCKIYDIQEASEA